MLTSALVSVAVHPTAITHIHYKPRLLKTTPTIRVNPLQTGFKPYREVDCDQTGLTQCALGVDTTEVV